MGRVKKQRGRGWALTGKVGEKEIEGGQERGENTEDVRKHNRRARL